MVMIAIMVCLYENKLKDWKYCNQEDDELKTQNQHYKQKNGKTLIKR
jgi:hypothetical protein